VPKRARNRQRRQRLTTKIQRAARQTGCYDWNVKLVAGVFAGLLGCSSNRSNPTTIRDTTGATFRWTCDENCTVTSPTPLPTDCGAGVYYAYSDIRVLLVCLAVPDPQKPTTAQFVDAFCRPVVCTAASECPQFVERAFACANGLCQWTAASGGMASPRETLSLCLANVPRPASCAAASTDSATLAAQSKVQCSDDGGNFTPDATGYSILEHCTVPPDCRQP